MSYEGVMHAVEHCREKKRQWWDAPAIGTVQCEVDKDDLLGGVVVRAEQEPHAVRLTVEIPPMDRGEWAHRDDELADALLAAMEGGKVNPQPGEWLARNNWRLLFRWTNRPTKGKDGEPRLWSYARTSDTVLEAIPTTPRGIVSLSLPVWVLMSEYDRQRALFDLFTRFDSQLRANKAAGVDLHMATLQRYGTAIPAHVMAIEGARTHAVTDQVVRQWEANEAGQLLLWPAVPVPDNDPALVPDETRELEPVASAPKRRRKSA